MYTIQMGEDKTQQLIHNCLLFLSLMVGSQPVPEAMSAWSDSCHFKSVPYGPRVNFNTSSTWKGGAELNRGLETLSVCSHFDKSTLGRSC